MGRDLITLCLKAATSPPPHRCLPHHRLTAARHLLPLSSSFSPLSFFSFSIGILALPAVTAQSGFAASSAALLGGWMFSVGEDGTGSVEPLAVVFRLAIPARLLLISLPPPIVSGAATGLLLAEVNINLLCEVGAGRGVSIR